MGRVRSFTKDDIPAVVGLRRRCFKHSALASEQEKQDYFLRIFFQNPWQNDDIPSLVCEDVDGNIVGFLGSIPRPISFLGEELWMATPTQLMSDPERGGMSGFQLMKAFLAGPQDFSLADIAAEGPRAIWERLGGTTAMWHSLFWTRPLRPMRFLLRDFRPSKMISVIGKAAYPVCAALDVALARSAGNVFQQGLSGLHESALGMQELLDCIDRLKNTFSFMPIYDSNSLEWLFDELEGGESRTGLHKVLLHDADGNMAGWYVYSKSVASVAQTLQVWASPEHEEQVFKHMYYDAWKAGCLAISGRCHPNFLCSMGRPPGRLVRSGPWTLVHSTNSDLLRRVCDGDAWLTRLEGEWWLNF